MTSRSTGPSSRHTVGDRGAPGRTGPTAPVPRGRNQATGREGETLAAAFLESRGMRILERNCRMMQGEIDIVAMDGPVLVFCEVKARYDEAFGPPEEAITPWKQRQMRRTAAAYLHRHGIEDRECRFDVVAILLGRPAGGAPGITLFKNAFFF